MNLVEQIASAFHDSWRKERLKKDGTYEPRWKKVKDANFVEKLDLANLPSTVRITEDNDVEIDIANSPYSELSADWQSENKQAAEFVIGILTSGKNYTRDQIGDLIHNAWLERNPWALSDRVLSKPFAELPEKEKNEDMKQYDTAVRIMNSNNLKR